MSYWCFCCYVLYSLCYCFALELFDLSTTCCLMLHWFVISLSLFAVTVGGRVPFPKHHKEQPEAPKVVEELEEKEKSSLSTYKAWYNCNDTRDSCWGYSPGWTFTRQLCHPYAVTNRAASDIYQRFCVREHHHHPFGQSTAFGLEVKE